MAALAGPASRLAEEIRTGQLGGVCLVNSLAAGSNEAAAAPHCDLCGSFAIDLPKNAFQIFTGFDSHRSFTGIAFVGPAARGIGLPPSRGPPIV